MTSSTLYLGVNPFETRMALREDGRLVAYRAERRRASSPVGNLYKGVVTRVLPGMQAAFVDVGLPRDAFLYVREAGAIVDEYSELFTGGDEVVAPMEGVGIGDLLREGQEILVQVVKAGLGTKGARLTTYITLPGRFLVLLPTVRHVGVSRRIVSPEERERLRTTVETFPGGGWIARTAAEGQRVSALEADRDELLATWDRVQAASARRGAPALLHAELHPALRTVRDIFTDSVGECWVDDAEAYGEILEMLEESDPELLPRVKLYRGSEDIMTSFGVDPELDKALRPKVWLKSGGYLVVNQTEALVAIDVNTGKYVGSTTLEDTVYRINREAVREVARQLRLRDLGGIVVIDFIDMEEADHRASVYESLAEELRRDPARCQLLPMSEVGLVQLTRKRTRPSLERTLNRECPYCQGSGRIKSLPTISLEIRRRLLAAMETEQTDQLSLTVHPDVSHFLQGTFRDLLHDLEEEHGLAVVLKENPLFHQEQFEIGR